VEGSTTNEWGTLTNNLNTSAHPLKKGWRYSLNL
jgi:hypothetical protein